MSKRFVLYPCSNIENCIATSYKGIRYILYDKYFMEEIANNTSSWSKISILAHEVGHHVNGHSIDLLSIASGQIDAPSLKESRQMEIEADEYSGFVMQKLGASLSQAQAAMNKYASTGDDSYSSHPSKYKRLSAIERGYNKAKGQSSTYSNAPSTLTAEDYFYRAYNAPANSHQFKIDNYDMCINLNFKYKSSAYFNRGVEKGDLKDYYGAIADYTKAISLNPNDADAYINRGISKDNLKDYYGSIADYTKAISLNPNYALPYKNRGIAKENSGKPYCSDYKKACDLGKSDCCEWYNNQCR
jgi:tetratricopeptide (TPR) repeat protein